MRVGVLRISYIRYVSGSGAYLLGICHHDINHPRVMVFKELAA